MGSHSTEAIRGVALVGHTGSGKTLLTEALLKQAKAIPVMGTIERGTTVCDFDVLEKEYQHSLRSSVVHFETDGTRIHLVDTPGAPDFLGQSIGSLAAVDTAAVVINAQTGIELTTSRMMQWADSLKLCRMIVVNRIDGEAVDLPGMVERIQEAFGKECLPINLPAEGGTRVVDCFFNPAGDSDFSSVEQAHSALVDQVVEVDEELMALYLEKGEVSPEQLHAPFEEALRQGHLIPICFTSAKTGVGVKELLDLLVKLAPNPTEGNPRAFLRGEGDKAEEFHAEPDPAKHAIGHVFKVAVDPFMGKLSYFKVHQGTVTKDSQLFIGDGRKPFKVGHLFMVKGKDLVEVPEGVPGDICAVAKVDEIQFDSVLHDSHDEDHIHLRPLEFPDPIFGLAIETTKRGDEQRLWDVLEKLSTEDPCIAVERVKATNETVVKGLGEIHLRTVLERMASHYKLEVKTHPPRIAYRETITAPAEGHNRHKKQTGGAGQFGEVFLRIQPLARGSGFDFVNEVKGGAIPGQFIPAVEKGVQQVMESGAIAGYAMQDVRVTVYDGKSHPVDSKEIAFVSAGRKAFLEAVGKARPIVLEPIVNIAVTVPEAAMGDITGDLSSKRGQITGTQSQSGGMLTISGLVPLSELSTYQSRLKSVTGGAGSYSIAFSHYEPVPPTVQQQLISEFRAPPSED